MANIDPGLGTVGVDPEDVERYRRIITPTVPPVEPPQQDHPIVQFARQQLAPLANYPEHGGLAGPSGFAEANPFEQAQVRAQQVGANLANAPVVGGLLRGVGDIVNQTMAQGAFGGPEYRAQEARKRGDTEAALEEYYNVALGAVGGLERRGAQAAGKALGAAGADQSAIASKFAAAEKAPLTKVSQAEAAASEAANPSVVGRAAAQRQALIDKGFTPQQVDEFAQTMAPKAAPRNVIRTAEGQVVNPALLTRSIQSATAEGVPLSQHSILGAKVAALRQGVPASKWGGDIGAATQLVMKGDEDALRIFGPELSQQLIQNKIAHLVRQTGAPEETIRKGLSVMGTETRSVAPAVEVAAVGKNVQIVDDAIARAISPKPGFLETAEERIRARTVPGEPPRPPAPPSGGYTPPPGGGFMSADTPLPVMPQRFNVGRFAVDMADETNALMRASVAGGDVSTVGLQGAPLLLKDIAFMYLDPAGILAFLKAEGKSTRATPYFQTAFARFGQALISGEGAAGARAGVYGRQLPFAPPQRIRDITAGFEDALAAKGINAREMGITDPTGGLTAREELAAGKIITNFPVVGLLYRQTSYATSTLLNAIRTGEALRAQEAYKAIGVPFKSAKVGNFVKVATGRADLPFGIEENAAARRVFQWLFFGPRLLTSAIKTVPDTMAAVYGIGKSAAQRTPLDPVDIARIQTTTTFVATGWGLMKLAEAAGFAIGVDPEKTDFGRITLPGGIRIDFWGPFNEEARLIARMMAMSARGLRGGEKPYGEADPLYAYMRSKLGPVASALESIRTGANQAGKTPQEVFQSTLANPNPLTNPLSAVPAPFTAQTAALAFDPTRGGPGGAEGAALTAAGALGISVLPPRENIPHDGIGRPDTDPSYGKDAIFDEYKLLFPDKTLEAPRATIGGGKYEVPLPSTERNKYIQLVGNRRRIDLGNLIYSDAYQDATKTQKIIMFQNTLEKANNKATREYLRDGLIAATDSETIRAEAVAGFHAQGGSAKQEAYWVAALDRAGKLTPDVKRAIDESNPSLSGKLTPITVDEYLRAAPLVHEYLSHVPYGTDRNPIGTPADWAAVQAAKERTSVLIDTIVRTTGASRDIAETRAKIEVLKGLTNMVQRSLYINGASLVNPQRQLLAKKYENVFRRVLDVSPTPPYQETRAEYENFY